MNQNQETIEETKVLQQQENDNQPTTEEKVDTIQKEDQGPKEGLPPGEEKITNVVKEPPSTKPKKEKVMVFHIGSKNNFTSNRMDIAIRHYIKKKTDHFTVELPFLYNYMNYDDKEQRANLKESALENIKKIPKLPVFFIVYKDRQIINYINKLEDLLQYITNIKISEDAN